MSLPWTKRESYLMVDHRASPGFTEADLAAARANGWALPPARGLFETAILVCLHCQAHVAKNPARERERGYCRACNGFICDGCVAASRMADYVHLPFRKRVDDTLERNIKKEYGNG